MILKSYEGKHPKLGERVFVAENAVLIGDVEVGDDCSIWYGTVIRADIYPVRIGARSNIQDNCTIHVTQGEWPTIIEEEVTLGHGVIAHGCTIRTHCLIGMGSILLDGVVVGEESLVGAGALVTEGMQIPPRSLVLGVPAKVRRSLTPEEVKTIQLNYQAYLGYKSVYLAEASGEPGS